jgi:hypothetical protein
MRHRTGWMMLIGVCLMVGRDGWGQEVPSAKAIVTQMQEKNAERQHALESYTSERTYSVQYRGTGGDHHGEMRVHVNYGDQGEKRLTVVAESGSKLICERVLRKMVETEEEASDRSGRTQMMLSSENYNFELLGQEVMEGIKSWVLHVSPKVENKLTYRGRIWVSEDDFAVVRVQGEPAKNPSWWINHASFDWRYGRHGKFWLPERSVAVSHVRIGGEAKLTIEYGSYHIVAQQRERPSETNATQSATMRLYDHNSFTK